MPFTTWEWIIIVGVFMLTFFTTAIIVITKMYKKAWNITYNVLEDSYGSGRWVPTLKGRCKLVGFNDAGAEIFYLPKIKKYRAGYGQYSGKNHMIWAKDSAGYWHNVYLGNFDKSLQSMGVIPVEKDMRFAESSIRKGIENRYEKKSFMEKYGVVIMGGMVFLVLIAFAGYQWLSYSSQQKQNAVNIETSKLQLDILKEIDTSLDKLNNIRTGGGGLVPAG